MHTILSFSEDIVNFTESCYLIYYNKAFKCFPFSSRLPSQWEVQQFQRAWNSRSMFYSKQHHGAFFSELPWKSPQESGRLKHKCTGPTARHDQMRSGGNISIDSWSERKSTPALASISTPVQDLLGFLVSHQFCVQNSIVTRSAKEMTLEVCSESFTNDTQY